MKSNSSNDGFFERRTRLSKTIIWLAYYVVGILIILLLELALVIGTNSLTAYTLAYPIAGASAYAWLGGLVAGVVIVYYVKWWRRR